MQLELLHTFEADERHTHALCFIKDGRLLLSGGLGGLVQVWDTEHWLRVRAFDAHDKATIALAIDPEGDWLLTVGADENIRLWSLNDNLARYTLHKRRAAVISPDGRHLAVLDIEGRLTLHALLTGDEMQRMPELDGEALCMAWTPMGSALLAGGAGVIHRFHPYTGQLVARHEADTGRITAMVFTRPERGFLTVDERGQMLMWSTAGRVRKEVDTEGARPRVIRVSPDGERVALSLAYQLQVRSTVDGGLIAQHKTSIKGMTDVAWMPDGETLACAGSDGKVRVLRLREDGYEPG